MLLEQGYNGPAFNPITFSIQNCNGKNLVFLKRHRWAMNITSNDLSNIVNWLKQCLKSRVYFSQFYHTLKLEDKHRELKMLKAQKISKWKLSKCLKLSMFTIHNTNLLLLKLCIKNISFKSKQKESLLVY